MFMLICLDRSMAVKKAWRLLRVKNGYNLLPVDKFLSHVARYILLVDCVS